MTVRIHRNTQKREQVMALSINSSETLELLKYATIESLWVDDGYFDPALNAYVNVNAILVKFETGEAISIEFDEHWFDYSEEHSESEIAANGIYWSLEFKKRGHFTHQDGLTRIKCNESMRLDEFHLGTQEITSYDHEQTLNCHSLFLVFNLFEVVAYYDLDGQRAGLAFWTAPRPSHFDDISDLLFMKELWKRKINS